MKVDIYRVINDPTAPLPESHTHPGTTFWKIYTQIHRITDLELAGLDNKIDFKLF